MRFRANQIALKCSLKMMFVIWGIISLVHSLKFSNFCVKCEVSRKFFREVANFGGILRARPDFSIELMWFQLSECILSNFLESYV